MQAIVVKKLSVWNVSASMFSRVAVLLGSVVAASPCFGQPGYDSNVAVTAATRLDWVFALANQSPKETPAGWLTNYDSTAQTYELFVPPKYDKRQTWPLILFISPSQKSTAFRNWQQVCQREAVLFAGPHQAGNNTDMRQRVRIVLDVLDDVRRKYRIDPDRTYIGGFSGGGRVACSIGFSLTELFGGVIPVCAAGDLRPESWLRHRAIDRLSVAHITGDSDFNQAEVERFRAPILSAVGVRSKVWVVPGMGHSVPTGAKLAPLYAWLEAGLAERRKLAKAHPAIRFADDAAPNRDEFSASLLKEGKQRLQDVKSQYSGLMLVKGVWKRWPDTVAGKEALGLLQDYDSRTIRPWDQEDIAEQRLFLEAQARGLDAYASGKLPQQYVTQRSRMAEAAISLWKAVLSDGQDKSAVAEAKKRIPELEKLVKAD
ncbi:MAG: hypothetical protein O3A00_07590 [Planctomycetota bacterium]|nr:hypothetical protein [Planctomycetota bacterium]